MADEVELRLRIDRAHLPRLRKHPAILKALAGPTRTLAITNIHFDTAHLMLLDRGISLRVRRMSGQWFQSVTTSGGELSGLPQRLEREELVAGGAPDFSKITAPHLTEIFDDDGLRAALRPVFRTEVRRTTWPLACGDGTRIELALDVGQLVAGGQRKPIHGIVLKLKDGDPARLFDLALQVQADIPLWLGCGSKAQRGYAVCRPIPPAIVKARPVPLPRGLAVGAAFQSIAGECLRQLQGNQEMVLEGSDIEGVHQMRVALRRLRSAMSVFRGVLPHSDSDRLTDELRWIAGTLGQARDLDVFLTEGLPPARLQLPDHAGLAFLEQTCLQARAAAYREVRAAVQSQRYQRLLLHLGAWVHGLGPEPSPSPPHTLESLARRILAKRYRRLRHHGRRLLRMHPDERHACRIAAKKLRYAAEFFVSLFHAARGSDFLPSLARLQDLLGVLNDIAVTEDLIRRVIGPQPGPAAEEALQVFIGWNACHRRFQLKGLEPAWNRFAEGRPFWDGP